MATDPRLIFEAQAAQGGGGHGLRGYIPDQLVRMLMAAQARQPDFMTALLQRPGMDRFGLTPETDFANLYTRGMARGDMQAGNSLQPIGTVLSPEQRTTYPALAPWPTYVGGGMGNNAPARGGHGMDKPKHTQPIGMAERTSPGGGGGAGY